MDHFYIFIWMNKRSKFYDFKGTSKDFIAKCVAQNKVSQHQKHPHLEIFQIKKMSIKVQQKCVRKIVF